VRCVIAGENPLARIRFSARHAGAAHRGAGNVNATSRDFKKQIRASSRRAKTRRPRFASVPLLSLALSLVPCGFPASAQCQETQAAREATTIPTDPPNEVAPGGQQPIDELFAGSIEGIVLDETGSVVVGARVTLTHAGQFPGKETLSDGDGRFSFVEVRPGPFNISIAAAGFAAKTSSGILHSGETYTVSPVILLVAAAFTEMHVGLPPSEVAENQIQAQEKQRVLGFFPNFYVSYVPNAVPLTFKQKLELAWKTTLDPVTFALVGATAGFEQAQNQISGYGQGAQGYAKRYGAAYGDFAVDNFVGGALLPSLLKQDPRYFYKGTGSKRSRILYAIAASIICKGDNGQWQPNYSGFLGGIAAGGISNLYYPPENRGAAMVFENAAIGIAESAVGNLLQEFLIRKLTPNLPKLPGGQP